MNLRKFTRRQTFTGIILLGVVALTLSLFTQPQATTSSFATHPANLYLGQPAAHNPPQPSQSISIGSKPNITKPVTTTPSTSVASQPARTVAVKIKPIQPPKPIMPRCGCPAPQEHTDSSKFVCPDHCAPVSPTPPPHCAPCGGFRKTQTSEAIMCAMYRME